MKTVKTVAEFFAGIGLMRMGLERAGWKVVWANDIDSDKMAMYHGHFNDRGTEFVLEDVHNLKGDDIPSIDLATASFPCNDLSLAGSRRGLAGQHSSAIWGFLNVIEDMGDRKPPYIMLENVTGFLTSHAGKDFYDTCIALTNLGYFVDAFILDAALFLPQSRQRLFVIGHNAVPSSNSVFSPPMFYECQIRPRKLAEFIFGNPDIRWDIRQLPEIEPTASGLREILEAIPEDSELWWSRERVDYLLNQMSDKHRAVAEKMARDGRVSYGTIFRRVRNGKSMAELRTDDIAGCLRTPRGGSGRQILFVAGENGFAARLLTPVECARLMGAGEYRITVSSNKALFGFGDAVCVPVIEWIAENYITPIWNEAHGTKRKIKAA